MTKFYKMMFMLTTVTGTLIAMSSYSWMSMWIGLEINLLSIIPLLSENKNLYPSESALKYFITQAMASAILLFAILVSLNSKEFITQTHSITVMILNSALLIKMGAAPFHAWFPEVMEGLSWDNSIIMLTWQKIAPMTLLMYNPPSTLFMSGVIILSSTISGIVGINQISLRKILAYSSINHIGWMISSMLNSQSIWLIYFLTYSTITLNIILMTKLLNIFYLKQLFNSLNSSKTLKFLFMMNFLSLGGIPPFLGFLPKWLTINNLINNNFIVLSVILIISTLLTMFFYLRISFSTLMINTNETLTFQEKMNYSMIMMFNILSLSGLLTCTVMFSNL